MLLERDGRYSTSRSSLEMQSEAKALSTSSCSRPPKRKRRRVVAPPSPPSIWSQRTANSGLLPAAKIIEVPEAINNNALSPHLGHDTSIVAPVWNITHKYRYRQDLSSDFILSKIATTLSPAIVESLIEAVQRILPRDLSTQNCRWRIARTASAQIAEDAFVENLRSFGYTFMSENEQRLAHLSPTPDVLFEEKTMICGVECNWLDLKDFFGFKENPYLTQSNEKQLRKYEKMFGSGAVVYALGYEKGSVDGIEGVVAFSREELEKNLIMQDSGTGSLEELIL